MTKHSRIEMWVPCRKKEKEGTGGLPFVPSSECSKCDYHADHAATIEGAFVDCDYPEES